MVDSLRHDLIQVVRRCGKTDCVITQKDINKILNGKYQEVIDDYAKSPKVRKVQDEADEPVKSLVIETSEPVHPDDDQNDQGNKQHDQDDEVERKPTAIPEREPTVNSKFF